MKYFMHLSPKNYLIISSFLAIVNESPNCCLLIVAGLIVLSESVLWSLPSETIIIETCESSKT